MDIFPEKRHPRRAGASSFNMSLENSNSQGKSTTDRIYEAVKKIPKGRVATYGQIAEMAGNRKLCRVVGNALHRNPDPEHIPCYRVVNARGEVARSFAFGGAGEQARLLEAEGVEVIDGKVDLKRFGIEFKTE